MKHLKHLARWLLIVLGVALVAAMWLALISLAHRWAPTERFVDCSMAEFHPDYTPEVRKACRERRSHKL